MSMVAENRSCFIRQNGLKKIAAYPGSRVEEFDTGHWVMSAKPEQFTALLKEWLATP